MFDLMEKIIKIQGTNTWKKGDKFCIYESLTSVIPQVRVWKLRKFEECNDEIRIIEKICGYVNPLMAGIVERQCRLAHR